MLRERHKWLIKTGTTESLEQTRVGILLHSSCKEWAKLCISCRAGCVCHTMEHDAVSWSLGPKWYELFPGRTKAAMWRVLSSVSQWRHPGWIISTGEKTVTLHLKKQPFKPTWQSPLFAFFMWACCFVRVSGEEVIKLLWDDYIKRLWNRTSDAQREAEIKKWFGRHAGEKYMILTSCVTVTSGKESELRKATTQRKSAAFACVRRRLWKHSK